MVPRAVGAFEAYAHAGDKDAPGAGVTVVATFALLSTGVLHATR